MSEKECCREALVEACAEKLKVCGHPVRLKLLCLIERQLCCVTDMWTCLGISQPVVSQHLAVLKQKGIVSYSVQGNKRIYHIVDPFIKRVLQSMELPEDE